MTGHETAKTEVSDVRRQIVQGMKILHGEAICHRDSKPQVHCSSIDDTHHSIVLGKN